MAISAARALRLLGHLLLVLGCGRTFKNPCDPAAPLPSCEAARMLVTDFERGLGPEPTADEKRCLAVQFNGQRPDAGDWPCDPLGLTPGGCLPQIICEGCGNSGLCPQYLFRTSGDTTARPYAGDYALRLQYWIDGTNSCMDGGVTDAFSLVILWLSNNGSDMRCPSTVEPWNISKQQYLRMKVRVWDDKGNLEVALQQQRDPGSMGAPETFPKRLLLSASQSHQFGDWIDAQVSVCDLLKQGDVVALDPSRITAVLIAVARDHFRLGNDLYYRPGARQIDVDDIEFVPCPSTGCPSCP